MEGKMQDHRSGRRQRDDQAVAMSSPIWLLDVDGVINASKAGWSAMPSRTNISDGAREYRISWAPALLDRIRSLNSSGAAEIRWCTTWCPWADQLERLFRLPTLARALTGEIPRGGGNELKLAAALRVLAEGRRLIWTDDTAIPQSGPAYDALTESGRALLIAPSPRRGLRPEHMDAIEAFAAHHV
jgi:hypothetical protein